MTPRPAGYDPAPYTPPSGGPVTVGWPAITQLAPRAGVLAIDGPGYAPWAQLVAAFAGQPGTRLLDARAGLAEPDKILARTSSAALAADPDFEALPEVGLAELFDTPVQVPVQAGAGAGLTVIAGPGAALSRHDTLWYLDLPKRYAEVEVAEGRGTNLGLPDRAPTTRRLFYVDWPLLDRHRDMHAGRVALWLDGQDPARPTAITGATLAATAQTLARQPFRTRPTFNSTPWGGQWGRDRLGMGGQQANTALGYELIAPESGVLVGDSPDSLVEVAFQLLVALHPDEILGGRVRAQFGTSFPIRFDYLDTVGGGNLSVHCHPRPEYMRSVFGWGYPQHESYYVMVAGEQAKIFLGLRDGVDVGQFRADADRAHHDGEEFDITRHVQTFPAVAHQLYLVPAGTPHGSGVDNVVLEISATPYLYSLRFYDWLRRDGQGRQRPVHLGHAFANLDPARQGQAVADLLVPAPRQLRSGEGWQEELLGALPEMFFDVRRLSLAPGSEVSQLTEGGFQVLNVVDGSGVQLRTSAGVKYELHYAETLVIPAAVGGYRLTPLGSQPVRVVTASIR